MKIEVRLVGLQKCRDWVGYSEIRFVAMDKGKEVIRV